MDYKNSLENLEKLLIELREDNKNVPIIVEGEKDIDALNKLEINGIIISLNTGLSITDFCDCISEKYSKVIILTDWDRHGGQLCHSIKKNLEGRVSCNTEYRKLIAKNSMIKTVEGLPSWIITMKAKLNH